LKIAITGHSRGLGAELAKQLATNHTVIGFSRSNGYDLNTPGTIERIIEEVKDCDVFINNAKSWWSQIDMFSCLLDDWAGMDRRIINIGSHAAIWNFTSDRKNFPLINTNHYTALKTGLKAACYHAWQNYELPMVHLVQPGPFVYPGFVPSDRPYMETEDIAKSIIDCIINNKLYVMELSIKAQPRKPNA
jgi:NAD(P)-dependent dehydrogenase (short-subunit alcohol dehydrogenase family)